MRTTPELLPPFTYETATLKVRSAENLWNSRDPARVVLAYSPNSVWRNRGTFVQGRSEIENFLSEKWSIEQDYRLAKELWCFTSNRIAVKFQYEYRRESNQWFRAYGNENWEFGEDGLMRRREASINDVPIAFEDRRFLWEPGKPRPEEAAGCENHWD